MKTASKHYRGPLGDYLSRTGLTQDEFAARLSKAADGWDPGQSQLSQWATLRRLPPPSVRAHIARATKGEIPVSAWAGLVPVPVHAIESHEPPSPGGDI